MNRFLLIFVFVYLLSLSIFAQTENNNSKTSLSKISFQIETGASGHCFCNDLNDGRGWISFYSGILVRKRIFKEKGYYIESGITYRKRGLKSINFQEYFEVHNIQTPLVVIFDFARKKDHGLLFKFGFFGNYSLFRSNPNSRDLDQIRKSDYGIIGGIGYKFKIKDQKFETWIQRGNGRYFHADNRSSPGGFQYQIWYRNKFAELGIAFPIKK